MGGGWRGASVRAPRLFSFRFDFWQNGPLQYRTISFTSET